MAKEKDEGKVATCEGKSSLIERIEFSFRYRLKRYKIVTLARDLIEDEEALVDGFRAQLMEDIFGKDSKLTIQQKLEKLPLPAFIKISIFQTALRLGANERILNEGWEGVTDALIVKRGYMPEGKEIPVSYDNLLALREELRTRIVNAISQRFRITFDEGEAKN